MKYFIQSLLGRLYTFRPFTISNCAVADNIEVRNIKKVDIKKSQNIRFKLLYDKGNATLITAKPINKYKYLPVI